jgi:hypothetical protein
MFAEDLSVFFNPSEGFAETATFSGASAPVILDRPEVGALDDAMIAGDFRALMLASSFPTLAAGNTLTVAGVAYVVREVQAVDDGALKVARLAG